MKFTAIFSSLVLVSVAIAAPLAISDATDVDAYNYPVRKSVVSYLTNEVAIQKLTSNYHLGHYRCRCIQLSRPKKHRKFGTRS